MSSWGGLGLTFSDGMCADCAARARAEWNLPPAPPRPETRRRRLYTLRPELALASIILIAATGGIGVVLGPPTPTTVYVPTLPPASVVASTGDPTRANEVTPTMPAGRALGVAPLVAVVPPRTASPTPETRGTTESAVVAPAAPPVRVSRAAAKRPRPAAAAQRTAPFAIPASTPDTPETFVDAPAPARTSPGAEQPWTTSLTRVPVQAP